MAIKAGQIVHAGNGVAVIDRIQTGGPGQLNIPTEKINELGNYKSVATIRDTPDLTFTAESFDVSTEFEGLVCGTYGGRSVADGGTNSSTTVTSATAAFTSADVGRRIIITKTDGSEYTANVVTVTNATTVVVDKAATYAGTAQPMRIAADTIDLSTTLPVDIASQFKAGLTAA